MRLFYAAFLAPAHREAYADLVTEVARDVPGTIRPVPAGSHHVTLGFLGEVADADVEHCRAALATLGVFAPIDVVLGPPRILAGRGRPRLVCVDLVEGSGAVAALQRRLVEETRARLPGVALDPKPPHVTIARFRKGARRDEGEHVAASIANLETGRTPRVDRFDRVDLVRSTLTPAGPRYESIGGITLGGADGGLIAGEEHEV